MEWVFHQILSRHSSGLPSSGLLNHFQRKRWNHFLGHPEIFLMGNDTHIERQFDYHIEEQNKWIKKDNLADKFLYKSADMPFCTAILLVGFWVEHEYYITTDDCDKLSEINWSCGIHSVLSLFCYRWGYQVLLHWTKVEDNRGGKKTWELKKCQES